MKNMILLAGLMACISIPVFSQADTVSSSGKNTLRVGLGYTNYTVFGSQVDLEASYPGRNSKVEHRSGIRINVEFRRMLTESVWVQGGLDFVQKGGYHQGSGFVDPARAEISYLQLPVMAGVGKGNENIFIGLMGGMAANFELSSGNTTSGSGWLNDDFTKRNIIPSYIIGLSADFSISPDLKLNADARYEQDLSAFIERSRNGDDFQIKIRGFSVSAALIFVL